MATNDAAQAVETPELTTAWDKLNSYMKMDRKQILEVAHNHPQFGNWYKEESGSMSFYDIVRTLLVGEFGRNSVFEAERQWINRTTSL